MVRGNFAVSVFWSSPWNITSAAAITRATMTAGAMIFLVMSATRLRDRGEVLNVGVEPRTVAEGVGEHPVERRHQSQAVVEVVLVLVQHCHDGVEVGQGGLEVSSALLHQRGQLIGQGGRRDQQVVHR